jgi:hypothetical protein
MPAALAAEAHEIAKLREGREKLRVFDAGHEIGIAMKIVAYHGEPNILPEAAEFHDEREVASDRMSYGYTVNGSGRTREGLAGFAELVAGKPALRQNGRGDGPAIAGDIQIPALAAFEVEVIDPINAAPVLGRGGIE